MRKTKLQTFQRLVKQADRISACGEWDYVILTYKGKERKFPFSLFEEHIKSIEKKYSSKSKYSLPS